MSNQEWQEGKTYRIKPDMVHEFECKSYSNKKIIDVLGTNKFTVKKVFLNCATELERFSKQGLNIGHWFNDSEIQYFDLVEDQQTAYEQDCVIKWLDKLHYVLNNDPNVEEQVFNYPTGLALETTLSSIYGATNIYEFVNMRYEQMQNEKSAKRKQELLDKQAELELELAKIKKELGE